MLLCDKSPGETEYTREIPECNISNLQQAHRKHQQKCREIKAFLLKSETRYYCLLSPYISNIILDVLATVLMQLKIN